MRSLWFLLLTLLLLPFISSCISDEDFPTPAGASFRLSVDTIDCDTVLSHTASATRTFTLYNDKSDGLSITNVTIEGDGAAQFLANIDGTAISPSESGSMVNGLDCRGKDSLIAFVQFNAKTTNQDEAELSEARLVFTLANGVRQSVLLRGYSQDAVILPSDIINTDTTLAATRPYVIRDSLVVKAGATLTLSAGTTLLFYPHAGLRIEGTLKALGTLEQPITFRGHRFDDMFKDQPYDRIDNQWQGITFTSTSYDNHLDYCDIHSGNWGIRCDSSDVSRLKLTIENSVIHNVKQDALTLVSTQAFIGNTQISNSEGKCVDISGGDQQFIHCSIASFSPFSATRGPALVFGNMIGDQPCALQRLDIINSIVTGYATDEIYGSRATDETIPFNYTFHNSLLCTPEITDEDSDGSVINNIWEDPKDTLARQANFVPFDTKKLIYTFQLAPTSKARGLADPSITQLYYPLDRLGRKREPESDAGCYQSVVTEEP